MKRVIYSEEWYTKHTVTKFWLQVLLKFSHKCKVEYVAKCCIFLPLKLNGIKIEQI